MHESLSAHCPPLHIELEFKQKAWFSVSLLGWKDNHTECSFSYPLLGSLGCYFCAGILRCVDLWGRCLGSGLEAEGCVFAVDARTTQNGKIRWFFSGRMCWATRKPKGGKKPNTAPILAHLLPVIPFTYFNAMWEDVTSPLPTHKNNLIRWYCEFIFPPLILI